MAGHAFGVAAAERIEAILHNPALYELAGLVPKPPSRSGGRSRSYPDYMLLVYDALISVFRSARQVEAELSHPLVWRFMRKKVRRLFPDDPSMHLPAAPMRRHHYLYGRNRYLSDPAVLQALQRLHRELAARQARKIGLLDPQGPGSSTHPDPSRMLHADGKVITPLYRAKPGETRLDKQTGEVRELRADPDAGLHFEGDGEAAWGTKFVLVAARSEDLHGRVILDLEWVPKPGAEAKVALDCFRRLAPLVPGAQGVVYDTALRGVHHQVLLRELGLLPVNKVTAAEKGASAPRRKQGRRVEKSVHVEDKQLVLEDGTSGTLRLFSRAGAIGVGELTDQGEVHFVELPRIRTHRIRDKSGLYRWYNDYRLPDTLGGTVTVRLHATPDDRERKLNRTENVRPIPPSDPDFPRLYARRNDAESINRGIVDSLYLGRAHSVGHVLQLVELLGFALMVNSLTLHRARASARAPAAA